MGTNLVRDRVIKGGISYYTKAIIETQQIDTKEGLLYDPYQILELLSLNPEF